MSDATDSNPYRSAADRARDRWITVPIEDRYASGMQQAAAARKERAGLAGQAAVDLAHQVSGAALIEPAPEMMWSVRGEPRSREHFGDPHPDDFPGGLPLPPRLPAPLSFASPYTLKVSPQGYSVSITITAERGTPGCTPASPAAS